MPKPTPTVTSGSVLMLMPMPMVAMSPLITMFEMNSGSEQHDARHRRAVREEHDDEHRAEAERVHHEVVPHQLVVRRRQHADETAGQLELGLLHLVGAAMNSLRVLDDARDVVALVVPAEERHVRRLVVGRDVLRRLRRRRVREEDEERLPDVARRCSARRPIWARARGTPCSRCAGCRSARSCSRRRGRARGSAGTSPSCGASAGPSWRRGRGPPRR